MYFEEDGSDDYIAPDELNSVDVSMIWNKSGWNKRGGSVGRGRGRGEIIGNPRVTI